MRYDLQKQLDQKQALAQLQHLISKGAKIELTEKRKQRTYKQNRYLHVILTSWGLHLGYDLDEMKDIIKIDLSPSIFKYEKNGRTFYKSTSDLDTKQMTIVVDKIRKTAQDRTGFYIPEPHETELLQQMENDSERYFM
jgi:hypothetical protein